MVYKYINERGLDLLRDQRIHISRPSSFNDPFEFLPQVPALTRQQLESKLSDATFVDGLFRDKLARGQVRDRTSFDDWFSNNRQQVLDVLEAEAKKYRPEEFAALAGKHFGVTCFAKIPDELLMWAHYANSHKGMVIGLAESVFGGHLRDVNYSAVRPEYHGLWPSNRMDKYIEIMSVKSDHWKYEQEVRLIIAWDACEKDGEHFYRIKPDDIREVLLGCRTPPPLEQDVKTLLARDYPHIVLKKMQQHRDRYQLDTIVV